MRSIAVLALIASAASAAPTSTRTTALDATTLTAGVVTTKIDAAYVQGIKRCYKEAATTDHGDVVVTFRVTDRGRSESPGVHSFSTALDDCVAKLVPMWRFPIPKDSAGNPTAARFEVTLAL